MRAVKRNLALLSLGLLLFSGLCGGGVLGQQTPQPSRPDDRKKEPPVKSPTPAPTPTPRVIIITPPRPKPEPRGNITVMVYPTDSRVMLDSQEFTAADSRGVVLFNNLTLTTHRIVVRRAGYNDYSKVFTPAAGNNPPLNVRLDPLPGTLDVIPAVNEALIEIKKLDGGGGSLTRTGTIENLAVPPGEYEVTISKSGYLTVTRTVTIEPAQSFRLELKLDPIEPPKRRPPERKIVTLPMTSSTTTTGKFLVVRLRSASGEIATNGSIEVMASKVPAGLMDVKGSLSGLPCEVEFVRMANVAEASLVEAPGPSNQWSTVTIRVRPKDQKRLMHFFINWRSLEKSAAVQ